MGYYLLLKPVTGAFGGHDPAVALFKDEELIYAIEEERIAGKCEWEETEFYRRDVANKSELSAKRRLKKLNPLRANIATGDYLSQRGKDGKSIQQSVMLPPEHSEVEVAIGRDGEIFFNDGKHRFSIARYAGIDAIPVRVIARHSDWQKIREEISHAPSDAELSPEAKSHLSHPDLQALIERRPDTD